MRENRSEREKQNIRYWTEFCDYLRQRGSQLHPLEPRRSDYSHYRDFRIGIPGFAVRAGQRKKKGLSAAFIIRGANASTCFHALQQQRVDIENACGELLSWHSVESEKHVAFLKQDIDVTDETDWSNQHEWLASKLEKLNEVFRPLVDRLQHPNVVEIGR